MTILSTLLNANRLTQLYRVWPCSVDDIVIISLILLLYYCYCDKNLEHFNKILMSHLVIISISHCQKYICRFLFFLKRLSLNFDKIG